MFSKSSINKSLIFFSYTFILWSIPLLRFAHFVLVYNTLKREGVRLGFLGWFMASVILLW